MRERHRVLKRHFISARAQSDAAHQNALSGDMGSIPNVGAVLFRQALLNFEEASLRALEETIEEIISKGSIRGSRIG